MTTLLQRALCVSAAMLLAACSDPTTNGGPQGLRETGYLTCEVSESACPDQLSCTDGLGQQACVADPCDGNASCACAAATVCPGATCKDTASGFECTVENNGGADASSSDAPQPDDVGLDVPPAPLDVAADTSPPPVDVAADTPAPLDVAPDVAPVDAGSAACQEATATLTAEMYDSIGSCTTVVRLDHDDLEVLGWQLFCGSYAATTEAGALTSLETALPQVGWENAQALHAPEDAFVFLEPPGDFGGVGAVSARTGLVVFGATIVWDGAGDIAVPAQWRPASALTQGCPSSNPLGTVVFRDLVDEGASPSPDAAVDVVRQTVIPAAAWAGGYVFGTTVLRYPRSVGAFNPATAEWIVMVHSGWLE